MDHHYLINLAIDEAINGVNIGDGGPFGALIVYKNDIIAKAHNEVVKTNDPTAHAEIIAIRLATKHINNFNLSDCIIYSSCEPCPMCLTAIYWARIKKVFFAATRYDAANVGFDDLKLYEYLRTPIPEISTIKILTDRALIPFEKWNNSKNKIIY